MASINAAWELLRDPVRRAAVDRDAADRPAAPRRAPPPRGDAARAAAGRVRAGSSHRAGRADDRPAPRRPRPCRPTGRAADRARAAATTRRGCGAPDGLGAAGPPPGDPSGSVLNFGRYAGWSLGEIARRDIDYIEWLDRMPIGRPYRDEIDGLLRKARPAPERGRRGPGPARAVPPPLTTRPRSRSGRGGAGPTDDPRRRSCPGRSA